MGVKKISSKLKKEGVVNCMIDVIYKSEYRQEMKDSYRNIKKIQAENHAKKLAEKEAKKAQKAEEKQKAIKKQEDDEYDSSLKCSAEFLTRLDDIERDVINYNNQPIIVKVGSKENLYDEKLVKYSYNFNKSQLFSRDYLKNKMFIKLGSSYSQIFSAEKYGKNGLLLNLRNNNKPNVEPDFALIDFDPKSITGVKKNRKN